MPIVGLEPSCTAVLRSDSPSCCPTTARGAGRRRDADPGRAARRHPRLDGARSAADVHAVAQPHCHQHAVMGWTPDAALLRGPAPRSTAVGGCCGLAGNFGVERGHYEVSVAVAETALLPAVRAAPTTRSCSPTGSPAARSSTSSAASAASTSPELLAEAIASEKESRAGERDEGFVPPPYPYDRLDEISALAAKHDGGAVDLSIGTPCDPPPAAVLDALRLGDTVRGYPPRSARRRTGRAVAEWIGGAWVPPSTPTPRWPHCVGRKEFVASTPQYLRLRAGARHRAVSRDQLPDVRDGRDARRLPGGAYERSRTSATPTPTRPCASG